MTTFDFQLSPSPINPGSVTRVLAYNETAYNWLIDEYLNHWPDTKPYVCFFDDDIEQFRNESEAAHFVSEVA